MHNRIAWCLRSTLLLILLALVLPALGATEPTMAASPVGRLPQVAPSPSATATTFAVGGAAWLPLVILGSGSVVAPTATTTLVATTSPTPTNTATTTFTLTTTATATPTVTPSATDPSGPCLCTGNLYNCGDFGRQAEAQACFDHCWDLGYGDVHSLDGDSDGEACESLP